MATYHVAHSGGDSTTILGGLQLAEPGDTLNIHSDGDGRYIEPGIFNSGADGSKTVFEYGTQESERITIQGAPGEAKPIFESTSTGIGAFRLQQTCKFLTIKDLILDGKNQTSSSEAHVKIFTQHGNTLTDVILDGLEIYNCSSHGIQWGAWQTNSIIRNCEIYDVGRLDGQSNCIYLNGGYNNQILSNQFYYTAARTIVNHGCLRNYLNGAAIGVAGPGGGPVAVEGHDNVMAKNFLMGGQVCLAFTGNDDVVKNNIIVMLADTLYGIEVIEQTEGTNDGIDIYNNTITLGDGVSGTGKRGIFFFRGIAVEAGLNLANNGIYGPATSIDFNGLTPNQNATNLTSDPGFAGVPTLNFHIASGGNWHETGTTVATVTDDYDGLSRPQGSLYDVGALEVPDPPQSDPVNTMTWPTTGVVDEALSVTECSVLDADDDIDGDADDNAGVWLRNDVGAVFSGTSTGTGTFQGEA